MDYLTVMAEAVQQDINSSLLLVEEMYASKSLVNELTKLKEHVERIHALLLDGEIVRSEDPFENLHEVRRKEIRRFLYDTDNFLDTINYRRQLSLGCFRVKSLWKTRKAPTISVTFRGDNPTYEAANTSRLTRLTVTENEGRQTYSFVDPDSIIGRDTDNDAITKMLLSDDHGEEIVVIPITGMALVGKTALAQLVYNNPASLHHFELRSWIWVGLEFNLSSMMKKVVEQWTSKNKSTDLEQLQILFLEKIQNKRYLLVLDDVYVIDRNVWLNFKYLLKATAPGSKVILTTRSEQVASTIGTVNSYELKPLSDDHALSLFTSLAFSPGQDVEETEVIDISKKILKKIGNVPLTIMTVGNLLHHQDISKWEELASCMEVPRFTQIVPILEHTYNQLPSSIKRCFAYCAIFPKGYTIDKRRLIQLWIAQGFVQLPLDDPNQSYEDTAENHFMELQSWFFFKNVICRDEQGNISFIMNELEYDLAQYVAAIDIKVLLSRDAIASTIPNEIYHLSVDYSSNLQESDIRTLPKELRSFINVSQSTIHLTSSYCAQLLSHLKYLRALDLHASDLPEIPNSIGSLKHLRYLNLSYNPFKSLPDSLMGLINLQVLDLSCCKKLEKLPRRLRRLKSLRHLYLGDCEKLACMPVGMGQMTSLQTLSHFVLGKGKNSCKLDELGSLNLKAELTIVFANSQ